MRLAGKEATCGWVDAIARGSGAGSASEVPRRKRRSSAASSRPTTLLDQLAAGGSINEEVREWAQTDPLLVAPPVEVATSVHSRWILISG